MCLPAIPDIDPVCRAFTSPSRSRTTALSGLTGQLVRSAFPPALRLMWRVKIVIARRKSGGLHPWTATNRTLNPRGEALTCQHRRHGLSFRASSARHAPSRIRVRCRYHWSGSFSTLRTLPKRMGSRSLFVRVKTGSLSNNFSMDIRNSRLARCEPRQRWAP